MHAGRTLGSQLDVSNIPCVRWVWEKGPDLGLYTTLIRKFKR